LLRPATQEVPGGRDEDNFEGTESAGKQTVLSAQATFMLDSASCTGVAQLLP